MGREVRRVAANFSWPIHKVWKGYINPYFCFAKECTACGGSGSNEAIQALGEAWYNGWDHNLSQEDVDALIAENRLMDFTHTWLGHGKGYVKKDPPYHPTAAEVNEWSYRGFGHDGINRWICIEAKASRMGITDTKCLTCNGEGRIWDSPADAALYEAWERSDPPSGEFWQMWETTSEGSPISPPMPTPEKLAEWLVANNASSFGDQRATYEQWLAMINSGWAPSAVMSDGQLKSGVEAIADIEDEKDKKES